MVSRVIGSVIEVRATLLSKALSSIDNRPSGRDILIRLVQEANVAYTIFVTLSDTITSVRLVQFLNAFSAISATESGIS